MLVNIAEEFVRMRLPELIEEYDCCKCEKCLDDMMAIALNNIPSEYVNSAEGMLYKRIGNTLPQKHADMDIEIVKAISLVSSNPKH